VNPKYSDALEAMRTYRKAMTAFLAKAPKRSAIYREAEVAIRQADELAFRSMLQAARGLVRTENLDVGDDPDVVIDEFRRRFFDTRLFFDDYAGGKFAQYLFHRHEDSERDYSDELARRLIEEARLFIEAAHACHGRVLEHAAAETLAT